MATEGNELQSMIRGFRKLADDDRALLCLWFDVSTDATAEEACRVLAKKAPSRIREDLISLTTPPLR